MYLLMIMKRLYTLLCIFTIIKYTQICVLDNCRLYTILCIERRNMFDYEPYRNLLKERKLKQSDLIERNVINRQNASKLKNNQSITLDTLDKICNKLDCDFSDIVRHYKE